MADIDTDPFGEHESRPEEPTDENIPLTPVGRGSTWEPEREQETSFGGNNKKRSHTQLDSRKQVIAFQDRVITINIKEALWKLLNMKPWEVLLKVCIKGYLEATMNPQEQSIFIISTSEMESYTTGTMSIP